MTDANGTVQQASLKDIRKRLKKFWIKKIKPIWRTYQVSFFLLIGFIALSLGMYGFIEYYRMNAATFGLTSISDAAYNAIQLFKIVCNPAPSGIWALEMARWMAFAVVIYASLRVVLDNFYEQTQYFYLKWIYHDHILVCGLGDNGLTMVKQFMESDHSDASDNEFLDNLIVVIDNSNDKEKFNKCKELGAIVLKGDPTDPEVLNRVQIQKAKYLFSIMDNDDDNVEVAANAAKLKDKKGEMHLECFLHISDNRLCNLLMETQKADTTQKSFSFKYFNVYDYGALALLAEHPVDMKLNNERSDQPYIAVIGLGKMGESLVIQAARKWRPRYKKTKVPLDIIVIDEDAGLKIESLHLRYPAMKEEYRLKEALTDANSHCSSGSRSSRPDNISHLISRALGSGAIDVNKLTAIFVCLDDDTVSLSAALTLHQYLKKRNVKVVVCMSKKAGLAKLLEWKGKEQSDLCDLYAFGLIDSGCDPRAIIDGITKIIIESEIPRLLYEHYAKKNSKRETWDEIPADEKDTNRAEAKAIVILLGMCGYDITIAIENPQEHHEISESEIDYMAQQEHKRWYDMLMSQGWVWGQNKDKKNKINPNLVPWDKLSPEVKKYNYDTVKEWPKILDHTGFQMIRTGDNKAKAVCEPIAITLLRS